jgi:hypothetical protein
MDDDPSIHEYVRHDHEALMPFDPTAYTAGDPVVATTVNASLTTLRRYVNRGIVGGDFDANIVQTEDVLEGDPVGATRTDYWAVSGDVHAIQADSARVNRQYLSGTPQVVADYSLVLSFDQSWPGLSKTFVVEREALVIMNVWAMVVVGDNNLALNTISPTNNAFFARGAIPFSVSTTKHFIEDPGVPAPDSGPQPAGSPMNRRPFSFCWSETLQPGTYTYRVYYHAESEKAFVSARNMTIEVLYL